MSSLIPLLSNALSVFMAVLFIPFSAMTYGIDLISAGERTDISNINIAGASAYFYSQGVTADGESFYFSSKNTLIKTKDDKKTIIAANYSAIPGELTEKYGTKHIGGISYYNGRIYAGMEDSKVFEHPVIGVFDSDTLELEEYYPLDEKNSAGELLIKKGVPWVAVDPESGYLYAAENNRTPGVIYYYDVNNGMRRAGEIRLDGEISMIQGAEFYGGRLFLATNDDTKAVFTLDIGTGKTEKYIDRNLTAGSEGEGMTVFVKDGKPVIVALDMGPLFVNAFVREYEFK
ncbi:MAG: hypothetical protein IKY00_07665 [Clostridia bacterium]|nr:hypothetical protein [Clostridia bacterium]